MLPSWLRRPPPAAPPPSPSLSTWWKKQKQTRLARVLNERLSICGRERVVGHLGVFVTLMALSYVYIRAICERAHASEQAKRRERECARYIAYTRRARCVGSLACGASEHCRVYQGSRVCERARAEETNKRCKREREREQVREQKRLRTPHIYLRMSAAGGGEHFSLVWNTFPRNLSSGLYSLLTGEQLVDVTLAAEGRILRAHKLILSVCSSYFRELFKVLFTATGSLPAPVSFRASSARTRCLREYRPRAPARAITNNAIMRKAMFASQLAYLSIILQAIYARANALFASA